MAHTLRRVINVDVEGRILDVGIMKFNLNNMESRSDGDVGRGRSSVSVVYDGDRDIFSEGTLDLGSKWMSAEGNLLAQLVSGLDGEDGILVLLSTLKTRPVGNALQRIRN